MQSQSSHNTSVEIPGGPDIRNHSARTVCCSASLAETHQYAVSRRAYYPSWQWRYIPVLIDLFHDETRSKLISALMTSLLYCVVTLQLFLPLLTQNIVTSVPTCFVADLVLGVSTTSSSESDSTLDREKINIYAAAYYLFWVFFCTTLAAVSRYHHPLWLLPACFTGITYIVLQSLGDTVYCFQLAARGNVYAFGHSATTIAFFNIFQWALTIVVILRLLMLVPRTLHSWRSSMPGSSWFLHRHETGWTALGPSAVRLSTSTPGPSWTLAWMTTAFNSAPLRHHIACIVSCIALVTIALEITTAVDVLSTFIKSGVDATSVVDVVTRFCYWAKASD